MDATKVASNNYKGFDILDSNKNYKSTYEMLKGISNVYKEIGEEDKKFGTNRQSLILETVANFCHFIQKCILRIYLIAGNTLEPFTTIAEKSRYEGFTTKGLVVLQRSILTLFLDHRIVKSRMNAHRLDPGRVVNQRIKVEILNIYDNNRRAQSHMAWVKIP